MHYLLVPDIGRHRERLLAEAISALVVALLTARLVSAVNRQREAALLRMQVISEMNHHIRNALTAISLTTDSIPNQQSIAVISASVERIEWALREILLRRRPLPEEECDRLRYPQRETRSISTSRDGIQQHPESQPDALKHARTINFCSEENTNEQR